MGHDSEGPRPRVRWRKLSVVPGVWNVKVMGVLKDWAWGG